MVTTELCLLLRKPSNGRVYVIDEQIAPLVCKIDCTIISEENPNCKGIILRISMIGLLWSNAENHNRQ